MKERIVKTYWFLKKNYSTRTLITSSISFIISLSFAIYNGVLGIIKSSVWNGSICIYYLLLFTIRGIIILYKAKNKHHNNEKKMFLGTSILTLILNISLIVPISLMVLNKKEIFIGGLIPAIAMATYTTYKITMGIINYQKTRKSNELLIKELRTINFIDAFVSLLTLQNTMILVNREMDHDMTVLSAVSSAVVLLGIIVVSILSLINGIKDSEQIESNH